MDIEGPDAHWAPPPPRWPVPPVIGLALPAAAPTPPAVPPRRRGRARLAVGAVLCTVLAVLFGSLTAAQFAASRSPRAVVQRYFADLAAGDAPAALGLVDRPAAADYLTSTVLKQQLAIARISKVAVLSTARHGEFATTQVSYRLDFRLGGQRRIADAVELVKHGSSWRLRHGGAELTMSAETVSSSRLSFAGRPLPTDPVQIFPGALPLATDSPAVQPADQPLIRLIDSGQRTELSVTLSDAAKQQLEQRLTEALTGCLSGDSTDPYCPQPDDPRAIPDSLRATINTTHSDSPSFDLSTSGDGRIELTDSVSVNGSWQVWDFNNQRVKHSGETSVPVQAEASVTDLTRIYWTIS